MLDQHTNKIDEVLAYIEEHLAQELTLDQIADFAGYSKFHLNRLFNDAVGMPIHRYIRSRRLTDAAHQLVHSEASISEIAFMANYDSQQAFTLAFKKMYQTTPNLYRIKGDYHPRQKPIRLTSAKTNVQTVDTTIKSCFFSYSRSIKEEAMAA